MPRSSGLCEIRNNRARIAQLQKEQTKTGRMKVSEAFPPRNGLHTREKKDSFGVCNANSLRGSVINSRFGGMILPITAAIYCRLF